MNNTRKKVVAVVSDLMFTVKIQVAAKQAGMDVTFVTSREKALEQAKLGADAMIIDLNGATVNALDLISTLKNDPETRQIELIGYVSHVQIDLKQAAQAKGCDVVVARSALERYLTSANE